MEFFLIYLLFAAVVSAQTCYWPNGEESGQIACPQQKGQSDSVCCGTQTDGTPAYCLTNGLCLSDFKVWRGSCTDETWKSKACPPSNYCSQLNTGGPFQLTACFNDPDGLKFGCYDCTAGNFSVRPGSFLLSPGQEQALGLVTATVTVSPTASPTNSSTSLGSTGSSIPVTAAGSISTSSSSNETNDSNQKTIVGLGAGLGVSLACALVAVLVLSWLLYRERKKKSPAHAIQISSPRPRDVVNDTEANIFAKQNSHGGSSSGYTVSNSTQPAAMLSGQTAGGVLPHGWYHEMPHGPD